MSVSAHDIKRLLAQKHADDVFIPECKDGASYGQGLLILDGWAMKKSWANPCATGYEIKVSRSDFMRDDKWRGYLDYCNEFYFVCPNGLIQPEEIPAPAGLLTVAQTGSRLFKKKKAEWRDVRIPDTIYRYILMSRIRVTRDSMINDRRLYWERWMEDQKADREFGWNVRGAIAKALQKKIEEVEKENKRLKEVHQGYEEVRRFLNAQGIDPERRVYSWDLNRALEEVRRVVPKDLDKAVSHLRHSLMIFEAELEKLVQKQPMQEVAEA